MQTSVDKYKKLIKLNYFLQTLANNNLPKRKHALLLLIL